MTSPQPTAHSPQHTAHSPQIALLKKHFANCFDKHGNFIPVKLQEIVQESGIALSKEGYSLNWLGKSYARLLANENIRTLLKADIAHNAKPSNVNSKNLLIKGDNLEVLKHLMGAYSEKIKMIYIDPPYNTGSDGFVYQDDRKFSVQELSSLAGIDEDEAKRILEFTTSSSNSHSAWLTFMYPRLYLAKELLQDEGIIFISIDDNEQAQLKILCDEVFGEENFVVDFLWKKKGTTSNVNGAEVSSLMDSTLCYKKSNLAKILSRTKEASKRSYPLNDIEGNYRTTGIEKKDDGAYKRDTMKFPIIGYVPRMGKRWQIGEDLAKELEIKKRFIFDGEKILQKIYNFEDEDTTSAQPNVLDFHGSSDSATKQIKQLFDDVAVFDTPKPTELIKHFLTITSGSNDLTLDFFAGSGTTAHAVMQLNAEDGGNRQFICVQLDEKTESKSEAYKAGYKSIFDITQARIEKAAIKIKNENPDFKGDLGFKVFETLPMFDKYLDTPEDLTENLELFDVSTLTKQDRHNLMLTWALRDGIKLDEALTPVTLGDYTAYAAAKILYFIEPDISLAAVVALLEQLDNNPDFVPSRVVVLGYLLDSKAQREMTEAVKQYNNRKGIELTLDIRYN